MPRNITNIFRYNKFKYKKFRHNNFRHNNFLKSKTGILILIPAVIVIIIVIMLSPHFIRDTYKVTITNKRVIKHKNTDVYLIYAQTEDGEIRVFKNANNFIEMKHNSEDLYWAISINKKYEITVYGFNIPLFSNYQNIVKVKGIQN
ncbi:DUF1523 family protein [Clostridium sp. 19966]|uniref:DUF1523 family protein n=1 Tax=Clostridium butyricum TaxID=1492 RepID=A0A6N3A0H6_CLOBU|nr:DUF1523 family protein [Clostridium sp. 19966]MDT8717014.1 DUF1523 family protein [Clostridium sp. 19966]